MNFATSGHEALSLLDQSEYDVLITDLQMPEMSGLELLGKVVNRHPQVVRMVLSSTADQEVAARSATLAHHCLLKPCDAETIQSAVESALSLRVVFDDPTLKNLVSGLNTLPSVPSVYLRLMEVFASEDVSPKQIADVIRQDMVMTAKVLQFVNSAMFGVQRQITDPTQAVIYLGPETVRQLVLVASAFGAFKPKNLRGFSVEKLQKHSLAVASLARIVAESLELSKASIDHAFVGGLLHDLGKLLLACNYPDKYAEAIRSARQDALPERLAEVRIFGTTHAEIGTYLLWTWALPDPITEVVLRHHEFPAEPMRLFSPPVAVHLADAMVNGGLDDHAVSCLRSVGLRDKVAYWQQMSDKLTPGIELGAGAHPMLGKPN